MLYLTIDPAKRHLHIQISRKGSNKGILRRVRVRLASQKTRACSSEFVRMIKMAPTNSQTLF